MMFSSHDIWGTCHEFLNKQQPSAWEAFLKELRLCAVKHFVTIKDCIFKEVSAIKGYEKSNSRMSAKSLKII